MAKLMNFAHTTLLYHVFVGCNNSIFDLQIRFALPNRFVF